MEMVNNFKVRNKFGLHARSAAKIVQMTNRYRSRLFLKKADHEVDASNILSILTLSCPKGTEIQARIIGDDSGAFMEELSELFKEKFGEDR